jgi:glycosyltransferase involved in cell wall biosynthesis
MGDTPSLPNSKIEAADRHANFYDARVNLSSERRCRYCWAVGTGWRLAMGTSLRVAVSTTLAEVGAWRLSEMTATGSAAGSQDPPTTDGRLSDSGPQPTPSQSPWPKPVTRRLRVLHVVESLGAGVATAVEDYVRSTPEHEHLLLGLRRRSAQTGDDLDLVVSRSYSLPAGMVAQLVAVRRQVRWLRPDVVHAHSSTAGAVTRLSLPNWRHSIVYTPHCFAFERRDLSPALRAGFWTAEAALSFGCRWVAAVGEHEAELARALPGKPAVVVVPQVAPRLPHPEPHRNEAVRVVAVGRLMPQKDPAYFAKVVTEGLRRLPSSTWTWIGGGDLEQEAALSASGARVTGWLSRQAVLEALAEADIYLHCAAWEGAPMSVFEAAALGLPVVGRRIPALEGLGLSALADHPSDVAALVAQVAGDPCRRKQVITESMALTDRHTRDNQRRALQRVYALASGAPPWRYGLLPATNTCWYRRQRLHRHDCAFHSAVATPT